MIAAWGDAHTQREKLITAEVGWDWLGLLQLVAYLPMPVDLGLFGSNCGIHCLSGWRGHPCLFHLAIVASCTGRECLSPRLTTQSFLAVLLSRLDVLLFRNGIPVDNKVCLPS